MLTLDLSDHLATYVTILTKDFSNPTKFSQISQPNGGQHFSNENLEKFKREITNCNWDEIHNISSADNKFETFIALYNSAYDKIFSTKENLSRSKPKYKPRKTNKPWILPWLQDACNRKNKLYHNFVKYPTPQNETKYKKMKIFIEKHIKKAKFQYYTKYFQQYSDDGRKQWSMINTLLNRNKKKNSIDKLILNGTSIKKPKDIAEAFNDYFRSIAENLKNEMPSNQDLSLNSRNRQINEILFEPCDTSEILTIIKSFKIKATADTSMATLKHVAPVLCSIISDMINSSLQQGIFPTKLKCAKVVPLHKTGPKTDPSNYRPISLLPIFSKIYERAVHKRIYAHFDNTGLFYESQFGFRPGHSCEHAILCAQHTILKAIDQSKIALLLLIDFSKAFDMVDHKILIEKLDHYGIRGNMLNWFRSYLYDRKQYVVVNSTSSSSKTIKYGVPQGSILGPLLFLIYINDMPQISNVAKFIFFADDANIIITADTITELINKVNTLLIEINAWVSTNGLKMNLKKTKYMIFGNTANYMEDIVILFNNTVIERCCHEKFLGIILDEKLNWNEHRKLLAAKISRNAGIIYKLRDIVPDNVLRTLYYSFIQSHLGYCSSTWGMTTKNKLKPLFIAQKKP